MTTPFGWCAADSGTGGPVSFRDLYAAYVACRRGKRQARNTLAYETRLLDRLIETRDALNAGVWRPSRTVAFVVDQPKPREIHAADFGDRVVHHWLVPRLEAWFEPGFIHDSYSNRQDKGTHAAVARLQDFLQKSTRSGKVRAFILQLDIANFFNSIDRPILLNILRRKAEQVWAAQKRRRAAESPAQLAESHATINFCLRLARVLLEHDARDAVEKGPAASFARVPPHKRLKNAPTGKGLPIGNLTSQFLANVYLDRLDQFVKHTLKCRFYLRYVDDFILVDTQPAQLIAWREQIVGFLAEQLKLRLKAESLPQPAGAGADFLGYLVRRSYLLPRRRVVRQAAARLSAARRAMWTRQTGGYALTLPPSAHRSLQATLASYLGHFRHAAAHRLVRALWQRNGWLQATFALSPTADRLWSRAEPVTVASFSSQVRFFRQRFPGFTLIVQQGNRLAVLPPTRPIAALAHTDQVRRSGLARLLCSLRRRRQAHVLVLEHGYLKTGFKRRVFYSLWQPAPLPLAGATSASFSLCPGN